MNIQDLIAQIAAFRKNTPSSQPLSHGDPEKEYREYEERELVKRGKILLSRYQEVEQQMKSCQDERDLLVEELNRLSDQAVISVPLPTGDSLTIDVSFGERFKDFLKEKETILGIQKDEQKKNIDSYDTSLLAEESDDLLSFLS